jgi:hypothetical protein
MAVQVCKQELMLGLPAMTLALGHIADSRVIEYQKQRY